MRTITRNEMKEILSNVNFPDMISFISKVPVKMNQYLDYWITDENGKKSKNPNPTVNPFLESGIINHSKKFKIITGFDYVNSVNNRLKKEGKEQNFVGGFQPTVNENGEVVPSEREVWFEMISKGLVTDRKTHSKFYLRYQFLKDSVTDSEYLYNGNPILKQLFESYMTKKVEDSYSNQGLDETLNFQVCDLNNITEISMGGEKYQLVD
jgi:hypothetical protein